MRLFIFVSAFFAAIVANATEATLKSSLSARAQTELQLAPAETSGTVLPTPATVRLKVEPVRSPLRPLAYRLGVSLQPFQPMGSVRVGDSAPYELSSLGTRPMLSLEGQWLPLAFESVPRTRFGLYAALGYAQHTLDLRSPAGASMENTQLHSMRTQGGLTASWQLPRDSKWSVHGQAGVGRWNTVQSSTSSYANQSSSLMYSTFGGSFERSLVEGLSGYAGYEVRSTVKSDAVGAAIPRDNYLVGFLGNFE